MDKKRVLSIALTAVSMLGVAGTAVLCGQATVKAIDILDDIDKDTETIDKFKAVAPVYAPTALVCASTMACILCNGVLSEKRLISATSGYLALSETFRNYRKAILEQEEGEKADRYAWDVVRKDRDTLNPKDEGPDKLIRWYEPLSDKFFMAYEREVLDVEYHMNRMLMLRGYLSLEEYWEALGLDIDWTPKSDKGWSINGDIFWMDFEHYRVENDKDGKPYAVLDCVYPPYENYREDWM